jgi:filamentous hemagglutinin
MGLDAHAIKQEFLGKKAPIAQYDLYVNNGTKEIYIFKKGGKGEGIATGYFIE